MPTSDFWLGAPGSMRIVPVAPGYSADPEKSVAELDLLSGAVAVQELPRTSRVFDMGFLGLADADRNYLRDLHSGIYGRPLAFVEPTEVNQLPPNVSSSGKLRSSTRGFTASIGTVAWVASGGTLAGGSLITWAWTGTVSKTLTFSGPRHIPVLPGVAITLSAYLKLASSTGTCNLQLVWLDSAGATISTSTVAGSLTTTMQRVTLTATPPATAVKAIAQLQHTAASNTINGDGWQLEYSPNASAFAHGPGVAWVSMKRCKPKVGELVGLTDLDVVLREVA